MARHMHEGRVDEMITEYLHYRNFDLTAQAFGQAVASSGNSPRDETR